jgi:mannan endo-1,4-beta-mannosidase
MHAERWAEVVVNRYKDDPTIFAWELINEARCLGNILSAGPSCVAGSYTVYNWYKLQSDFIRSL